MGDKPDVKEVETFDKNKLRRTKTEERNILPTKQDIDDEKKEKTGGTN